MGESFAHPFLPVSMYLSMAFEKNRVASIMLTLLVLVLVVWGLEIYVYFLYCFSKKQLFTNIQKFITSMDCIFAIIFLFQNMWPFFCQIYSSCLNKYLCPLKFSLKYFIGFFYRENDLEDLLFSRVLLPIFRFGCSFLT